MKKKPAPKRKHIRAAPPFKLEITREVAEILLEVLAGKIADLRRTLRVLRDDPHPSDRDKYHIVEVANTETMTKVIYDEVVEIYRKFRVEE